MADALLCITQIHLFVFACHFVHIVTVFFDAGFGDRGLFAGPASLPCFLRGRLLLHALVVFTPSFVFEAGTLHKRLLS